MDTLHEEKRHGLTIKIFQDDSPISPEENGDDNLFLVGYHRDFTVEGPRVYIPKEQWKLSDHKSACNGCGQRNFKTVEESGNICGRCGLPDRVNRTFYADTKGPLLVERAAAIRALQKKDKDLARRFWVFPLEAYIHSGVSLALSNEGSFPDRAWDVSQLGAVFVAKSEWKRSAKARKAALSLIQEWNNYLAGNVYGYKVENAQGEEIESCWGFSGDYTDKDYGALNEARAVVDAITKKGETDEHGQRVFSFDLALA